MTIFLSPLTHSAVGVSGAGNVKLEEAMNDLELGPWMK
jgi:hypothetical protein